MSGRDYLELSWHFAPLALALPAVLAWLQRARWARALFVAIVLIAALYHLAVVRDCQTWLHTGSGGLLCRWGS